MGFVLNTILLYTTGYLNLNPEVFSMRKGSILLFLLFSISPVIRPFSIAIVFGEGEFL